MATLQWFGVMPRIVGAPFMATAGNKKPRTGRGLLFTGVF